MNHVVEAAKDYFKKAGWEYDDDERCLEYWHEHAGEQITFECGGLVDEGMILVFAFYPYIVPREVRENVVSFLNSINATLFFGNLELNEDTGILKLRHGLNMPPGCLTEAMMDHILRDTLTIADEVFPLVEKVVSGEYEPDEEFDREEMEDKAILH